MRAGASTRTTGTGRDARRRLRRPRARHVHRAAWPRRSTARPARASSTPSAARPLPRAGRRRLRRRCPSYPSLLSPRAPLGDAALAAAPSGGCSARSTSSGCSGPHPLCLAFAALARAARASGSSLGVRQDFPTYVRSATRAGGWCTSPATCSRAPTGCWRGAAPTVVVGPRAGRQLPRAPAACCRSRCRSCATPTSPTRSEAAARPWDGRAAACSASGRLETEKNPLLLADVLARLRDGPALAAPDLRRGPDGGRAARAPRASWASPDHAELLGYVPIDGGLLDLYRSATRSCTCPGPRACRRCCSRRSPPACRWSRPPWAACPRPPATRRCWSRRATRTPPPRRSSADRGRPGAAPASWSGRGSSAYAGRTLRGRKRSRGAVLGRSGRFRPDRLIELPAHRFAESPRSAGRAGEPVQLGLIAASSGDALLSGRARQLTP